MKKPFIIPALILGIMLSAAAAYGQQVVKENRDVRDFSVVNFGGSGDLYISFGQNYSVTLEGEKRDLENVTTVVEGQKLNIKRKSRDFGTNGKITVRITMPEIKGLDISGSAKAEINDPIKGENLDLDISGSGKVMLADVDLANLTCSISGSGTINLNGTGKVSSSEVAISGSGSYRGEGIKIDSFKVAISGSGNCYCHVDNSLRANISGSGNVIFTGNPRLDARVSGSGRVRSN